MKLRFLSLGLLALGFIACETYEESDSVAAMRNARAEVFKSEAAINLAKATLEEANAAYRNAEAAVKNFEAALKEAQVKAQQLANAKAEALDAIEIAKAQAEHDLAMLSLKNDEADLANALLVLENTKITLEGQKMQAEYDLAAIANAIEGSKNEALNEAFGVYTTAYGVWNEATNDLLDANNTLITSKYALASFKYDFENMDVKGDKEAEIALLNNEKDEFIASLEVVTDLKETNDWDAFIVTRDAMEAELDAAQVIQGNGTNADVVATKAAKLAAEMGDDAAEDALAAANEAVTAANTIKTDAYLDILTWTGEHPLVNANTEKGIYESVAAMQAGLAVAKAETLTAKNAMDDKQAQIDDVAVTAENKAIYEEELVALTEDYTAKKAVSDAYEANFEAKVVELNDAYSAAIAAVEAAEAAQLIAVDAKTVSAKTLADAETAADAAIAAEAAAIAAIDTEVKRLNALVFIYNTSTEETEKETLENMTDAIADAIEDLEDEIKNVEEDIYTAEKELSAIENGDYTQAEAVRNQELAIAKAESNIERLKLLVAEAKADLDNRQAEYNALLED